ncbi:hypothetical protein E3N88_09909 [Mikania micrantha]|uniref:Uncharacterized protein n=1 Tax=Mikania micrantha TaxID=192012 RepID=A0A5N6PA85_9ASTR|nr:hypothetical protein E3N88_09909 [Mikania micrantha]
MNEEKTLKKEIFEIFLRRLEITRQHYQITTIASKFQIRASPLPATNRHPELPYLKLTPSILASAFVGLRLPLPPPPLPSASRPSQMHTIDPEFQSSVDTPTKENNPNVIISGEANEAARDTTTSVEQANAAN